MALYNKDGTVYKLEGPNPVMKDQQFWSDYTVHNMNWKKEIHKDQKAKVVFPPKKEVKTQSESFVEELEASRVEEQKLQQTPDLVHPEPAPAQPTSVVVPKQEVLHELAGEEEITKTFIHCLPAVIVQKKDSLYGDVSSRVQYKNKTSFEAVILNQTDMSIEMWSQAVFEKGSILYPKNGDKRWWKIHNYYPKLGGHVIQAVPSQDQPYFE